MLATDSSDFKVCSWLKFLSHCKISRAAQLPKMLRNTSTWGEWWHTYQKVFWFLSLACSICERALSDFPCFTQVMWQTYARTNPHKQIRMIKIIRCAGTIACCFKVAEFGTARTEQEKQWTTYQNCLRSYVILILLFLRHAAKAKLDNVSISLISFITGLKNIDCKPIKNYFQLLSMLKILKLHRHWPIPTEFRQCWSGEVVRGC